MKKKRVILKTSTAVATAVTLGAISTASLSSCNKFIVEPSSSNFSISPDSYSGDGNTVNWTATRNVDGQIEEKTGSEVLTQDITSFDVIFDSGATHTYAVKWIYTVPHSQYLMDPIGWSSNDNVVNWTSRKVPIGGGDLIEKSGTCKLNASNVPRTSYTVNFGTSAEPDYYTFTNLNWEYKAPTITYDITPTSYSEQDNTVNWIAHKRSNNTIVQTKSGTYTLNSASDNKTSWSVTFDDGSKNTFNVNWTYVVPTNTYSITPTTYSGFGDISWTAEKYSNNILVETVTGKYTLQESDSPKTSYTVNFDGDEHEFTGLGWTYVAPEVTYNITPKTYSDKNNTVNWTATKSVEGSETPITVGDTYQLYSDEDNVTTWKVDFNDDEHEFEVSWTYTEPTITYDITPLEYNELNNTVNWTAHRYSNDVVNDTKSGQVILTENIHSFPVTFDGDDEHTYTVNWIYNEPQVDWEITPLTYANQNNIVSWNAKKNVYVNASETPDPTLSITKTGTYTLNSAEDNLSRYTVNFGTEESPENHEFTGLSWSYVAPTIDYDITPTTYSGTSKTISWTAHKVVNGVTETKSGTYTIADGAHVELFSVTFDNADVHEYTVNWTHELANYFVLTSNAKVTIINPTSLMTLNSSSTTRLNNKTYTSTEISDVTLIKEIHITPNSATTAAANYGRSLCRGMTNLTVVDINLPDFTTVGDYFFGYAFQDCTSLTTITNFTIPQTITSIGSHFCRQMFYNATSMPIASLGNFNLPQSTNLKTVGTYFCSNMFYNCKMLTSLPSGFNLPQSIETVGEEFAFNMFLGCTSLSTLPSGFNIPPNISGNVSDNFCASMFNNCSSLTKLPAGFNIPQGITSVGISFVEQMFLSCSSLQGTGASGTKNFYSPISSGSYTSYANELFKDAKILIAAGCSASPTVAELKSGAGYNITRG